MFSKISIMKSTENCSPLIERLKNTLDSCDAVVIGAGAGLSTSAGFSYSGERFMKYFSDFAEKYGIKDMYSGGFYSFADLREQWAWWSRNIYINRYMDASKPIYDELLELVKDKDYFVITTNVDHCFQKAGFDKKRLYYTQGDYGLFQCSVPCHQTTYDNQEIICKMVESQGYEIDENENLFLPAGVVPEMKIPEELVPHCEKCGSPMTTNLRVDSAFVEDEGWHAAANRYSEFLRRHEGTSILFFELGVGLNTPAIIKYPFWQLTAQNPKAVYACVNYGETFCPKEIEGQAICISKDIGKILEKLI